MCVHLHVCSNFNEIIISALNRLNINSDNINKLIYNMEQHSEYIMNIFFVKNIISSIYNKCIKVKTMSVLNPSNASICYDNVYNVAGL